jgi:hypothetical protein
LFIAEAAGAALFVCGKYAVKTGRKMWRGYRGFLSDIWAFGLEFFSLYYFYKYSQRLLPASK